ncbi:TPA: DUF551 domain-containing protein [Escherichia coli]|nr:DUF551 domain-containing protein [Escherichia coli]
MSTISKERLEQLANFRGAPVTRQEEQELARIALASLEAEAVCVIDQSNLDYLKSGSDADVWPVSRTEMGDVLLYRSATPAPVSVPAAMEMDDDFDSSFEHGKAVGWNACRAAMLQAEPVSNSDELPLDYLQGHKDGLEWAAQLAEANHPQTGDWLYDDPIELARAIRKGPDMPTVQGGNSPVIPDGWVACSERMPGSQEWVIVFAKWANQQVLCWDDVQSRWTDFEDQSYYADMFSHWMPLPAAPQQEV